ncbi:hypothetical protein ACS0TY_031910 [Phlomoides rotata]
MTENSKLADMVSDNLNSPDDFGDNGGQKISVSNHVNCLQHSGTNSDSFVVDMERFSHLIEKEINSKSRVTRNLSRKVSIRNGERKITGKERDTTMVANSPRATLNGISVPEKASVVALQDHSSNHHQITITTVSTAAAEIKPTLGKKPSFRRSSSNAFAINPRRLLFFFATLSCIGTIVLIYFTLSMGKPNGDDAAALD